MAFRLSCQAADNCTAEAEYLNVRGRYMGLGKDDKPRYAVRKRAACEKHRQPDSVRLPWSYPPPAGNLQTEAE